MTNNWLKEGKRTEITSTVKKIAKEMGGENFELVENISKFIRNMIPNHEERKQFNKYDKRIFSVDDILKNKHCPSYKRTLIFGCIQAATLFRTFCIAKGIPAVFVETLKESWIKSGPNTINPKLIEGHIFVDTYIGRKWYTIDPIGKTLIHEHHDYSIEDVGKYIAIRKGLDSEDIGFPNMDIFRQCVAKEYDKPYLL